MTRAAAAAAAVVEAVLWMKGAKTLVEDRKTEVLMEAGLRDTVDVRSVAGAVECSGEERVDVT
jgi:hypothetical protein